MSIATVAQLWTIALYVALLPTLVANWTFRRAQGHWRWPLVSLVVILGGGIPVNRSGIVHGTLVIPKTLRLLGLVILACYPEGLVCPLCQQHHAFESIG